MKSSRLTRRQFFKLSLLGTGTLALPAIGIGSIAAAPPHDAQAALQAALQATPEATPATATKLSMPQPVFTPIASTTAFGTPTDISAGWDGTLWAIDASGAPHLYDPTADVWLPHDDPIDAAAAIGNTLYVFQRGHYDQTTQQVTSGQYLTIDLATNTVSAGPTDVAATWPNLPDSFKLRLTGATNLNGTLILFNGGWYVPADGSSPRAKLTDLANWPQAANWVDGVIDSAAWPGGTLVRLFRGDEYIVVDLQAKRVTQGPQPARNILPPSLATAATIDAASLIPSSNDTVWFRGTSVVAVPPTGGNGTLYYIPALFAQWPITWHPVLNHAPSGRSKNLWVATKGGNILQHNGEAWTVMPGAANTAAVGQDNTVMVSSQSGLYRWNATTNNYDHLTGAIPLVQVAVGDAGHVWVRDGGNAVQRYDATNGLTPVALGAGVPDPTHISANGDGTLWHCNSSNPNAFRLIAGANQPSSSLPIKNGELVTSVQKVASTGFGAAHCLATHADGSTNLYRYDSPYVFKTAASYPNALSAPIQQGLGQIYFLNQVNGFISPEPVQLCIVALDTHTGREVSRSATNAPDGPPYRNLIFDPVNDLVYACVASGTATDMATPGRLLALDARDLTRVVWSFETPTSIDAAPTLHGTQLCFGDRQRHLYMFDTRAVLAGLANGQAPAPQWTWQVPIPNASANTVCFTVTPVIFNGMVYAGIWATRMIYPGGEEVVNLLYLAQCAAKDNTRQSVQWIDYIRLDETFLLSAPVLAANDTNFDNDAFAPALFISGSRKVWGVPIGANGPTLSFTLPGSSLVASGLAYDDGTRLGKPLPSGGDAPRYSIWFGDTLGNLWGLANTQGSLEAMPYTPHPNPGIQPNTPTSIKTTPILYKDPQGGMTVIYGAFDNAAPDGHLIGFDPDNGNAASIGTGVTQPFFLSQQARNGTVFVGGAPSNTRAATQQAVQIFGIRVDALPQALRDFVIESQLMQDPDQAAQGGDPANKVPPSVARYQTHLTIVDDQKAPISHEPVKLWCDTPNTQITVDGQAFTIGPDDAAYAAVKTGTDGTLVITTNATDYFAPTLRAWAGFMNPYERIVINADAEFHQRVMTAHANATDADPDKVNLQTATRYDGASLFTADEKSQNPSAPQNVANSIQTANTGLGLNNASNKAAYRTLMRAMGVKHKNQRVRVTIVDAASLSAAMAASESAAAETPDKYLAYADLPGATHFPTNVPSSRLASIVQPIGLSYARPNGDKTKAPTFQAISHADARAAIDGLQGEAWKPTDSHGSAQPPSGSRRSDIQPQHPFNTFNIFQDFWNWLKGLFDKIAQCILSIAEDILAGIQYFVDGVLKVFKAIIKVLEDVFPFLGSFFKMLEKLIDDVVEALSVLFHFGEIIKTHNYIREQVNTLLDQAESAIANQVKPAVDNFFQSGETAVKNAFDALIAKIEPNKQGSNLKGAGATAHSAFSAGPGQYGNSSGTSHAVQCSYGLQKLKSNAGAGKVVTTPTSGAGAAIGAGFSALDDTISDLWTTFTQQISNNATLNASISGLNTSAGQLFQSNSASSFFQNLLVTLLELLETLIEGALVVANAFVDLLLNAIGDIIASVKTFLNTPIDIPFISWLYQTIFGEPLTLLNAICLVAAIPITVLYRVIEGRYPSQDFAAITKGADRAGMAGVMVNSTVTKVLGAFGGILAFATGIVNGINDSLGENSDAFLSKVSAVLGVTGTAIAIPLASSDTPSTDDWLAWGGEWCASVLGIFGAIEWTGSLATLWNYFSPGLTTSMGLFEIFIFSYAFGEDGQFDPNTDLGFAANILSAIPGVINPLKLASELGAIVVAAVDVFGGMAVCVIDMLAVFGTFGAPEPAIRYHMPWIQSGVLTGTKVSS